MELPNAISHGVSGDPTFGILEILNEITEGTPAKVFLLIGVNNISRNYPDATILKNYESIITYIKTTSPETKLYV